MAKIYVEKLSELIERALPNGVKGSTLEVKHFFSGAAVYANSKICITLSPVGLALKLPKDSLTKLMEKEGGKPLQYFSQGPIKKDYVILPGRIINNSEKLGDWFKMSIEYATSDEKG